MTRETIEDLKNLLSKAEREDGSAVAVLAQQMTTQHAQAMQAVSALAMDAISKLQAQSAQQDALIREIMSQRLSVFVPQSAKLHATISRGHGAASGVSRHPKQQSSSGGGVVPAFDQDDDDDSVDREEVIADLSPLGRSSGHGFQPG